MANKVESGHGLLFLSQIIVPQEESSTPKTKIKRLFETFNNWGFNFVLPVVCLTNEEEKYRLLTGLPIYEAAKEAKLKQIWVFLVAVQQAEAEKIIEEVQFQSSLNEKLIESKDLEEFREFLNDEKSKLTLIPGIKDGYAKLIKGKRPFKSVEEMQKGLGAKRSLNWLIGYKKLDALDGI